MTNQNILHRIERENVLQNLPSLDDLTLDSNCGTCHGKGNGASLKISLSLEIKRVVLFKQTDCNSLNDSDIMLGPPTDDHQHVRRKRNVPSSTNNAYTMKVLVAVDAKMEEYHKANQHDWKQYVLTLMSIVSYKNSFNSLRHLVF